MKKGFTLTELLVVVVLISIMAIAISKLFTVISETKHRTETTQMLRNEGNSIIFNIVHDLSNIGEGLFRTSNELLIRSENTNDYNRLFFFLRDSGGGPLTKGRKSLDDIWVYYYQDGTDIYRSEIRGVPNIPGNIIDPTDSSLTVLSNTRLNSTGIVVESLIFNIFASRNIQITDTLAASSIRIVVELSRGGINQIFSKTVLLTNIINALEE